MSLLCIFLSLLALSLPASYFSAKHRLWLLPFSFLTSILSPPNLITASTQSFASLMNPVEIPEILSCICSYLDKSSLLSCVRVSRYWSRICIPLLWRSCTFSADQYSVFHDIFDEHAPLIRNMEAKHRLIGGEMRFVAQLCTHLCSLTLRSCRVSPSSLDILCSGIPRVQFLVFDLCLGVTSASVASRLTRLPRLSHLEIMVHLQERGHGDWRENDMALLLTGCLSLESIKIVGSDLSHVHLLNVQRHESPLRLKYLYLISTFISENALKNLLSKCPSLSTLILLQNANKNATVQAIAETCPNLTMLELRNSKSIATFAFDAVFKGCPLLTHLDISYTLIFDAAVSALAQHCPELRVLDLTGCSRVTNASFREMMAALRHLRELKVGGCSKIKVEGFSGQEAWASRDSLEVLEMPFVGIRANVDVLHGLVAHLRSLTRLRRWTVDEEVGQHSLMQDVLKDRPEVVVSIAEPVEWRTSERHSLHCT